MQVLGQRNTLEEYLLDLKAINPSKNYEDLTRRVIKKLGVGLDYGKLTKDDIMRLLDALRKPEEKDPLHKWIGTYNLYVIILKKFFKWNGNIQCMEGIKKAQEKEKSIYKPSDMWWVEDNLLFLKYCNNKRDKCYHLISRQTLADLQSCLKLKVKNVLFKQTAGKQYAEILVNGKTGY